MNWKTWNSDYQEIIKDIRRYYIFSNLKEDTEIIIEFMRSYNENETGKIHLEKKYQEKNKLKTKKIVVIHYLFSKFDKLERFAVGCYRKDNEKIQAVFESL